MYVFNFIDNVANILDISKCSDYVELWIFVIKTQINVYGQTCFPYFSVTLVKQRYNFKNLPAYSTENNILL